MKRGLRGSGDEGIRTPDPRLAKAVLSQLSYIPRPVRSFAAPQLHSQLLWPRVVGLRGFEPLTPALSAQCSNQLSYRPLRFSKRESTFFRIAGEIYSALPSTILQLLKPPALTTEK